MKKNNLFFVMIALFVGALCFTSCKDACEDVSCENGGTCNDGDCMCLEGFTGANCETAIQGPCDDVNCENGGTCVDGDCMCLEGFTGANCETPIEAALCDDIDATFSGDVKDVLSVNCSYEVCHGSATTFGQLDFNDFSNLKTFLDSGSFEARVLNGGNADNPVMPPAYAPEGKPKELTAEQLEILNCWKEAGYPES